MREKIILKILGKEYDYYAGVSLYTVSKYVRNLYPHDIILAKVNGKLMELMNEIDEDAEVEFLTTASADGNLVYKRTANMVMQKAFRDVFGEDSIENITIEYSVDKGYYCTLEADFELDQEKLDMVKNRMKEIAEADFDITVRYLSKSEALKIYKENKRYGKVRLTEFCLSSSFKTYFLDDYIDYFYGFMAPCTGFIKYFDLLLLDEGFVLQLPMPEAPETVPEFKPAMKLFELLKASSKWNELMGVKTIAELNQVIADGRFYDLVLVQEALQERVIGEIARKVTDSGKRIVLIAGPSSSGKTSFSHRLSIQLMANGLKTHPIPVDNYFVDRDKTPKNEDGTLDYESIHTLDLEKFNSDMAGLLRGEAVHLSSFDFVKGKSDPNGELMQIGPKDVLLIEGIHSLNDEMTYALPAELKYKVYISALTALNIDDHNRISTTDGRLIRRMCRDASHRGASASDTIAMWHSVRRGEESNIFPYQENCDIMFNSTLIYELAVLKQYAEPLLFSVKPGDPSYDEARRLLIFLSYFVGVDSEHVPHNSIIREFIGGSCFNVG